MECSKIAKNLNEIFLQVKSEISHLEESLDFKRYEINKKKILGILDGINYGNIDELILIDQIKIYYRFCDNNIIPKILQGDKYNFMRR